MARLGPLGFTHEQYLVLLYLGEAGALTQRELARRSHTNPNTVTSILRKLQAEGLVRRERHERDGRALTVAITEAGRETRRRLIGLADENVVTILADMTGSRREIFLSCLDEVAEAAERALE